MSLHASPDDLDSAPSNDGLPVAKVAVIYYSATGTVHALASSIADGARNAGAEVRLLQVAETASESAVAANPAWSNHREQSRAIPVAVAEDVLWADAIVFGSPTRFGNVASQLKQFIDALGGPWSQGLLADKVYSGFTASNTAHGGQESTLLALYNSVHHFGGIVVAPGYTDPVKFVDGNPYGSSHVAGHGDRYIPESTLHAAAFQGARVSRIASALAAATR